MSGQWASSCTTCKARDARLLEFDSLVRRICGRHPFVANDERRLLELIRAQKLRFDAEKFRHFSPEGLDFLRGMLVYDTVHRRTMGELIAHPWLTVRETNESKEKEEFAVRRGN